MSVDVSKMTYSDFCEYADGEGYDRLVCVIAYDDFCVYKDKHTGRHYYLESGENDASDFFELEIIAWLRYDESNDLNSEVDGGCMSKLFPSCICCGEYKYPDGGKQYLWFRKKNE